MEHLLHRLYGVDAPEYMYIDRVSQSKALNSQVSNAVQRVLGNYDLCKPFRLFFLHESCDGVTSCFGVVMPLSVISFQCSHHQRQTLTFSHHQQTLRIDISQKTSSILPSTDIINLFTYCCRIITQKSPLESRLVQFCIIHTYIHTCSLFQTKSP